MKSILISLFICLSMCGSFVTLYGQNSTAFLSVFPAQDSIIQPNSLRFGTDKLANTFIFRMMQMRLFMERMASTFYETTLSWNDYENLHNSSKG